MSLLDASESQRTRTAHCSCGNLRLSVRGEPARVYACACLECQRATGTVFAYRARYRRDAVVADEGERRRFRRIGSTDNWMDQVFCPDCGTLVYMEAEAIAGEIVISVGCFDQSDVGPPAALFWARRMHGWLHVDDAVEMR